MNRQLLSALVALLLLLPLWATLFVSATDVLESPRDSKVDRVFANSYFVIVNTTETDDDTVAQISHRISRNMHTMKRAGELTETNYTRRWDFENIGVTIMLYRSSPLAMQSLDDARNDRKSPLSHIRSIERVPKLKLHTATDFKRLDGATLQPYAHWHLDRVDQGRSPYDGAYTFSDRGRSGEGTNVYILDTGIQSDLPDFGGRAKLAYSSMPGELGGDCNGHGTHVAGIVGSKTYGFAKKANIHAIKVLDCDGLSSDFSVVDGLHWISKNAQKPAIVSMSLGGDVPEREDGVLVTPDSSSLEAMGLAIDNLVAGGIHVIVSAGNENRDSCEVTPAFKGRDTPVITVSASDINDNRGEYANYGACTNIFAPGTRVFSTWRDGTVQALQGTSMAAPAVSGVAAMLLAEEPSMTPAELKAKLIEDGVKGVVGRIPQGSNTPNVLLHSRYSVDTPVGYLPPLIWLATRDKADGAVIGTDTTFAFVILGCIVVIAALIVLVIVIAVVKKVRKHRRQNH